MSVATNFPTEPGYYWAKWRIATDETLEGNEVTPSDLWEIVQVNDNNGEPGTLEELSVAVAGVRESQWRDGFFWGERVADLNPIRPQPSRQAQPSQALQDITSERQRQQDVEGWTPEHDDEHSGGELALAAACYVDPTLRRVTPIMGGNRISDPWPWWGETDISGGRGDFPVWGKAKNWWKPKDRRRDLVRAGALIAAEIERLDRAEAAEAAAT